MALTVEWERASWRMTRRLTVEGAPPLAALLYHDGATMRPHLITATWISDSTDHAGWRVRDVTIHGTMPGRTPDRPVTTRNSYVRISDLPDWAQPLVEQTRPTTPTD